MLQRTSFKRMQTSILRILAVRLIPIKMGSMNMHIPSHMLLFGATIQHHSNAPYFMVMLDVTKSAGCVSRTNRYIWESLPAKNSVSTTALMECVTTGSLHQWYKGWAATHSVRNAQHS